MVTTYSSSNERYETSARKCVSHTSKSSPKNDVNVVKCTCNTSRLQVKKANQLPQELRDILDRRNDSLLRCHGRAKSGDCENRISKKNTDRIAVKLKELAGNLNQDELNTDMTLLGDLSHLLMCQRWHQDQAPSKFQQWKTILESEKTLKEHPLCSRTDPHSPSRLSRCRSVIETPESRVSPVQTCPSLNRIRVPTSTTPQSTASSPSLIDSKPRTRIDRPEQVPNSPAPISRRTRSAIHNQINEPAQPRTVPRTFEPFSIAKSPTKATQYVMEKITEDISTREIPPGYVYGFRRPGCNLIKIGTTTTTVMQRLKSIEKKCNYAPILIFEIRTEHAMKVERLVHRHLCKQIRRECLIEGLCNEGKGCPTRHKEWFEGVNDEYAESVVRAWVRWMDGEPYDEKGVLKQSWAKQTMLFLHLKYEGDFWMKWTELTVVNKAKGGLKDEPIGDATRKEEVLRKVDELSRRIVVLESDNSMVRGVRWEMRDRCSDFVSPRALSRPVDVFA